MLRTLYRRCQRHVLASSPVHRALRVLIRLLLLHRNWVPMQYDGAYPHATMG